MSTGESRPLPIDAADEAAIRAVLASIEGPPMHLQDPIAARAQIARRRAAKPPHVEPGVSWSDRSVAGPAGPIIVRRYAVDAPLGDAIGVYCHGGGWVRGDLDDFDIQCSQLALHLRREIVSVDYRLAPEHRYPAALDDVLAVVASLAAGPIFLIGESAGGALALSAALKCRDIRLAAVLALLLFYPLSVRDAEPTGAALDTPLLVAEDVEWCWRQYLPEHGAADGYAEPGSADLAGLPPCVIVQGAIDPVSPSVIRLARRLAAAGSEVDLRLYNGLPHAFTALWRMAPVADVFVAAVDELNRLLD